MKTVNLSFDEAIAALKEGKRVKLPEWTVYWFMSEGFYKVFTADCKILDTPYLSDYKNRTDWEITDGRRDFGGAIKALKAGKSVARSGWNGKGMFLWLNKGSAHGYYDNVKSEDVPSDSTIEGIRSSLFELGDTGTVTRLPNINMRAATGSTVTGWLASQTDMLAEDWEVLD
jgi:hypothetical protein